MEIKNKRFFLFLGFLFIVCYGQSQERIAFEYKFEKDSIHSKQIYKVKAKITNKTDKDIYFLSETCNGLDSFLSTDIEYVNIYFSHHCRKSYPQKNLLKANSSFEFKSMIRLMDSIKEVSLNLEFVELKSTAKTEGGDRSRIIKKENIINRALVKGDLFKL